MLELVRVDCGRARHWLEDQVRAFKASDDLAPVTVVCSSQASALSNRRALSRAGSINTRFDILPGLAETLAAPLLAEQGFSPLTPVLEQALVRGLLTEPVAGPLRTNHPHVSTIQELIHTFRLYRDSPGTTVDALELSRALAERGRVPAAFGLLLAEYEKQLRLLRLYDDCDRMEGAQTAIEKGASLRDVGSLILHLPLGLSRGAIALVRAIGDRTTSIVSIPDLNETSRYYLPQEAIQACLAMESALEPLQIQGTALPLRHGSPTVGVDLGHPFNGSYDSSGRKIDEVKAVVDISPASATPTLRSSTGRGSSIEQPIHITATPSAAEEVRCAVRWVLAQHARGVPLYEMAILHNDDRTYKTLLANVLDAADVPFTTLGGRQLSDSWAARGLLGLLRIRDSQFSRVSVLAWLNGFPWIQKDVPQPATWERLTREAGVVRGIRNWQEKLTRLAAAERNKLKTAVLDDEAEPPPSNYVEETAHRAEQIAKYMTRLEEETTPPTTASWEAYGHWARTLFRNHVLGSSWVGQELEAGQHVLELLSSLSSADGVGPHCNLPSLIETLEVLFESRRQPTGRMGRGVITGPVQSASGMQLSRILVLGMTESAFPRVAPPNGFVPVEGADDPLDYRSRDVGEQALTWIGAISSAQAVHLSFPTWDADSRPVYPSRWLVQAASDIEREALTPIQLRTTFDRPWFTSIASPIAGVRQAPEFVDLAEYRFNQVLDWTQAKRSVASHPLAMRPELPLRRLLEISSARESANLTAADGNLADHSLDGESPTVMAIATLETQSATRLQTWATCPFRYFMERILYVQKTEKPEDAQRWTVSSRDQGSLIHAILERFFREVMEAEEHVSFAGYGPEQFRRLEDIAIEEFGKWEADGLTGHPLVWAATRARILADLETLLHRDDLDRLSGSWRPVAVEQAFGAIKGAKAPWPAVAVDIGAGDSLAFRGLIDRVDQSDQGDVRVTDYKSGSATYTDKDLKADPVIAGTALQLALYGRAIRGAMSTRSTTGRYWYISTKGDFKSAQRQLDGDVDRRLDSVVSGIISGIELGAFPQIPKGETYRPGRTSWHNCVYCAFDRICPTGRDLAEERKRDSSGCGAFYALELSNDE